jgi:hypothetical protein
MNLPAALVASQAPRGFGVLVVGPARVRRLHAGALEGVLVEAEDAGVDVGGQAEADVGLRDLEAVPLALDEINDWPMDETVQPSYGAPILWGII